MSIRFEDAYIEAPPAVRSKSQVKVCCMNCMNGNYPLVECDSHIADDCDGCPCKGCDQYCMVDYKKYKSREERLNYIPSAY